MFARAAAALGAKRDDVLSLFWMLCNPGQVLHCLRVLVDMHRHGGSVVCVPSKNPLICTMVQLDGDFVTFVDPRAFTEGHATDDLIRQHADALQAHIGTLGETLGRRLAGAARALRDLLVAGWAGSEAVGAHWSELAPGPILIWQAVAIGVPLVLGFATPPLLRWLLHRAWRH